MGPTYVAYDPVYLMSPIECLTILVLIAMLIFTDQSLLVTTPDMVAFSLLGQKRIRVKFWIEFLISRNSQIEALK